MKIHYLIIALIIISKETFGLLPAPYLISANPLSDTSGHLAWRNNSASYKSIVILRRQQNEYSAKPIDTVSYPNSEYYDFKLRPSSKYFYAVYAYSQTELSDTSNIDSLLTLDSMGCTRPLRTNFINWLSGPCYFSYDTANRTLSTSYNESACDETGLLIYRAQDFGPFTLIGNVKYSDPNFQGARSWTDSNLIPNTWYSYKIGLFNSVDTVLVHIWDGFTLHASNLFYSNSKEIILADKKSEFPIYYGGWALKSGDSIIIKESNSANPTLLNISNGNLPEFKGYLQTKAFTNAFILRDCLFESTRNIVRAFHYANGTFTITDSLILPLPQGDSAILEWQGILNDSTILVNFTRYWKVSIGGYGFASGVFPIIFNGNAFPPINSTLFKQDPPSYGNRYSTIGCFKNKAFIQLKYSSDSSFLLWDYGISLSSPPEYEISRCKDYQASSFIVPKTINGLILNDSRFLNSKAVMLNPLDSLAYILYDSAMIAFKYGAQSATPLQSQQPIHNQSSARCKQISIYHNPSFLTFRFSNPQRNASIFFVDLQGRLFLEYRNYAAEYLNVGANKLAKKVFIVQVKTRSNLMQGLFSNY